MPETFLSLDVANEQIAALDAECEHLRSCLRSADAAIAELQETVLNICTEETRLRAREMEWARQFLVSGAVEES